MPRYFFHIGGEHPASDPEGCDYGTLEDARQDAVQAASEMVAEGIISGEDRSKDVFNIADESGLTVLSVPFSVGLPVST